MKNFAKTVSSLILTMSAALAMTACADNTQNGEIADPFEGTNRMVFGFNDAVDDAVIHPVVTGYRAVVPKPGRMGLRNFLRNLKSPVTFANQVLQGDVDGAGDVVVRTTVNTLLGVGGIVDVAGAEGLKYEPEDFGQTLAVWGVGHGPYIVVPFLGPSSLRDYAGYAVDTFADPLRWYLYNTDEEGWYYAKMGADYLDLRESLMDVLKDLESSSVDYYAAVRSTYVQRRQALVNDQAPGAAPAQNASDLDEL